MSVQKICLTFTHNRTIVQVLLPLVRGWETHAIGDDVAVFVTYLVQCHLGGESLRSPRTKGQRQVEGMRVKDAVVKQCMWGTDCLNSPVSQEGAA